MKKNVVSMARKSAGFTFIPIDPKTGKAVAANAQEAFLMDNGPDYFSEGMARILKAGRFGFIDEKGRVVIEAIYDFAAPFGLWTKCPGQFFIPDKDGRKRNSSAIGGIPPNEKLYFFGKFD